MGKNFSNLYTDRKYDFVYNRGNSYWEKKTLENGYLFSVKNSGWYRTKITENDLPEDYLKYWNGLSNQYLKTSGVVDIFYQPVLENHLFKDDSLYISYHSKIKINGSHKAIGIWYDVDEESYDERIWGNNLINFLIYAEKYSNYDISEIKEKIWTDKILWLKDNEPEIYVEREKFDSWFDKKENVDIPYVVKKVF